jgi:NhaA family Na+:H+ antiporter
LPHGVSWRSFYGVCLLSGIGFTMSLFIGSLAFAGPEYASGIRLGVFLGSILAGLCGYLLLRTMGTATAMATATPPTVDLEQQA